MFALSLLQSQVEKYMKSLPPECVPTLGTEGETYRRKQCFLQLPVYDFSLDACHKMSDLEKKRYVKFTSRRSENFFGVGTLKLQGSEEEIVCIQPYTIIHVHAMVKPASCLGSSVGKGKMHACVAMLGLSLTQGSPFSMSFVPF